MLQALNMLGQGSHSPGLRMDGFEAGEAGA